MPFTDTVKEDALVKSRRSCCLCNEFVGLYTNVHHIIPERKGGASTIDNAIVLCLRCHGEAGHYNPKHPIGDKYKPSELIRRRDLWWQWCHDNPGLPPPKHPISLSPAVIALTSGSEWRIKTVFSVYNTQQRFFYGVWIKIGIASPDAQYKDIAINLLKGGLGLKLHAGSVELNAVAHQWAALDQSGNKAIFLVIFSFTPNELYTFQIEQSPISQLSQSGTHNLNLAVAGFSENPPGTGQGSGQAYMTFTPPENFTVLATRLMLRKN